MLDWELSSFGEPLVDISFQIINWLIPSGVLYGIGGEWKKNGLPSASDFLSWYEYSYKKKIEINLLRNAGTYNPFIVRKKTPNIASASCGSGKARNAAKYQKKI